MGGMTTPLTPAFSNRLRYVRAGAFLRFGTWIARPSATRPDSLIASESVGCGAMPSATVSTVDSPAGAATPPPPVRPRAGRPPPRLDHVGDVRADHDEAEQLAVVALVDRLDPARRL